MHSKKTLKNPRKYILPYKAKFPVPISIIVNGKKAFFPANRTVELNQSEFEAILNSAYGEYL